MSDYEDPPQLPWRPVRTPRHRAIFTAIGAWVTMGLGNLGLSLGLAMAIGGAVTNLAIGAALMGLQSIFTARPGGMKTPQAQVVLNQSTAPRIRGYGYGYELLVGHSRSGTARTGISTKP